MFLCELKVNKREPGVLLLQLLVVCLLCLQQSQAQCLECWYDICLNRFIDLSDAEKGTCCTCVLNQPVSEVNPACLAEIQQKYSNETTCCNVARSDFISTYDMVNAFDNSTACSDQMNVFNQSLTLNLTNYTSIPTLNSEYILTSMELPCNGCISRLELATEEYIGEVGIETVFVHLWNKLTAKSSFIGDTLYERKSTFNFTIVPEVLVSGNGSQVLGLTVGEAVVCFEAGDVLGLSWPPTSNLPAVFVTYGNDSSFYRIETPEGCEGELDSLFEPDPDMAINGELQVLVVVTGPMILDPSPTPTVTTAVVLATTSSQMGTALPLPTSSPTDNDSSDDSSDDSETIIYIVVGVLGFILIPAFVGAVVLNIVLCKKWKGAKNHVIRRIRSIRRRESVQSMQPNMMYNSRDAVQTSETVLSPKLTTPASQREQVFGNSVAEHVYEELPDFYPPPDQYASVK